MSQKHEHETDHDQDHLLPSRWQSVVEEKIAAAREQGEFDDLPGRGEPLRLKENPLAGDWELAFHVLENAEMAPPWMEMSREIKEGEAELAGLIAGPIVISRHRGSVARRTRASKPLQIERAGLGGGRSAAALFRQQYRRGLMSRLWMRSGTGRGGSTWNGRRGWTK